MINDSCANVDGTSPCDRVTGTFILTAVILLIKTNFSIYNNRDVSAVFKELHNLFALSGQFRPPRFGICILFQPTHVSVVKAEIDLKSSWKFGGRVSFRH